MVGNCSSSQQGIDGGNGSGTEDQDKRLAKHAFNCTNQPTALPVSSRHDMAQTSSRRASSRQTSHFKKKHVSLFLSCFFFLFPFRCFFCLILFYFVAESHQRNHSVAKSKKPWPQELRAPWESDILHTVTVARACETVRPENNTPCLPSPRSCIASFRSWRMRKSARCG